MKPRTYTVWVRLFCIAERGSDRPGSNFLARKAALQKKLACSGFFWRAALQIMVLSYAEISWFYKKSTIMILRSVATDSRSMASWSQIWKGLVQ